MGCRRHSILEVLAGRRWDSHQGVQRLASFNRSTRTKPPIWRRLFHLATSSTIPFIAIFVDASVMVAILAPLSGIAIVVETVRFRIPSLNKLLLRWLRPLLKETEDRTLTGATYISLSALASFLLFDKSVAISVLLFLSVGDPIAAVVGSSMKGFRVFGKSPGGTAAFAAASFAMVGILSVTDAVSYHWALLVGACVAALTELLPLPLDDNLTIPLVSGAVVTALM